MYSERANRLTLRTKTTKWSSWEVQTNLGLCRSDNTLLVQTKNAIYWTTWEGWVRACSGIFEEEKFHLESAVIYIICMQKKQNGISFSFKTLYLILSFLWSLEGTPCPPTKVARECSVSLEAQPHYLNSGCTWRMRQFRAYTILCPSYLDDHSKPVLDQL